MDRSGSMADERGQPHGTSPFSSSPAVCVTLGDLRGIGPEVAARALASVGAGRRLAPLVIGRAPVFARALELTGLPREAWVRVSPSALSGKLERFDELDVILPAVEAGNLGGARPLPGPDPALGPDTPGELAGRLAGLSIELAVVLAMAGTAKGIVTAPIDKHALNRGGYRFPGHTEMLRDLSGSRSVAMMLVAGRLRVTIATTHIPFRRIVDELTPGLLQEKMRLTARGLEKLFGIPDPRIGLCALNPHAGESGMIGDEEERLLAPAVSGACEEGIRAAGPLSADTIFHSCVAGDLDAVVALYHDQGMIPVKVHGFGQGVNLTLGLPFVRTSPDHGTAADRAWRGVASAGSMEAALELAIRLIEQS